MSSSGIKPEPTWTWDGADATVRQRVWPGSFDNSEAEPSIKQEYQAPHVKDESEDEDGVEGPPPEFWESEEYAGNPGAEAPEEQEQPSSTRTWPSRTCRICFEVVPPTLHTFDALPGFMRSKPRVTYVSEEPELGRLIRPCKCKGSSRYVHEGCLQQWRLSDTTLRGKNYWSCSICGFKYRLARMTWGRVIKSTATQIALTIFIFAMTIFILGFVADPIINFYLDPLDTLTGPIIDRYEGRDGYMDEEDEAGWIEHFVKGVASLGLLGAIKMFFTLSPWNQWSLRSSFANGSRAGRTGRDRLSSVTWILIVTGILTFLWTVWKGVRAWSRRTLEQASDKVMDVPLDDDEEELVDPTDSTESTEPTVPTDHLLTNES